MTCKRPVPLAALSQLADDNKAETGRIPIGALMPAASRGTCKTAVGCVPQARKGRGLEVPGLSFRTYAHHRAVAMTVTAVSRGRPELSVMTPTGRQRSAATVSPGAFELIAAASASGPSITRSSTFVISAPFGSPAAAAALPGATAATVAP